MDKHLRYTIFQWKPLKSDAPVYLGILFHAEKQNYLKFFFCKDVDAVSKLSQIDKDIIMRLLTGMRDDIESKQGTQFTIEEYTQFFLNDFQFTDIQTIYCYDLKKDIAQICKDKLGNYVE